jgi:hypothetical protein
VVNDRKEVRVRRTTVAVVLATGALSVPAVALAAGGDDSTSGQQDRPATTPVQQEQQAPDRGPCPEKDGSGSGSGGSNGGSGSETTL